MVKVVAWYDNEWCARSTESLARMSMLNPRADPPVLQCPLC